MRRLLLNGAIKRKEQIEKSLERNYGEIEVDKGVGFGDGVFIW